MPRGRFDIEMYVSGLKLVGQVGQLRAHTWGEGKGGPCACVWQAPIMLPASLTAGPARQHGSPSSCSSGCPYPPQLGRPYRPCRTARTVPYRPAGPGLPHPVRLHRARLPAAQGQRAADAGGHLAGPAHSQGADLLQPHTVPGGCWGGGLGGMRVCVCVWMGVECLLCHDGCAAGWPRPCPRPRPPAFALPYASLSRRCPHPRAVPPPLPPPHPHPHAPSVPV